MFSNRIISPSAPLPSSTRQSTGKLKTSHNDNHCNEDEIQCHIIHSNTRHDSIESRDSYNILEGSMQRSAVNDDDDDKNDGSKAKIFRLQTQGGDSTIIVDGAVSYDNLVQSKNPPKLPTTMVESSMTPQTKEWPCSSSRGITGACSQSVISDGDDDRNEDMGEEDSEWLIEGSWSGQKHSDTIQRCPVGTCEAIQQEGHSTTSSSSGSRDQSILSLLPDNVMVDAAELDDLFKLHDTDEQINKIDSPRNRNHDTCHHPNDPTSNNDELDCKSLNVSNDTCCTKGQVNNSHNHKHPTQGYEVDIFVDVKQHFQQMNEEESSNDDDGSKNVTFCHSQLSLRFVMVAIIIMSIMMMTWRAASFDGTSKQFGMETRIPIAAAIKNAIDVDDSKSFMNHSIQDTKTITEMSYADITDEFILHVNSSSLNTNMSWINWRANPLGICTMTTTDDLFTSEAQTDIQDQHYHEQGPTKVNLPQHIAVDLQIQTGSSSDRDNQPLTDISWKGSLSRNRMRHAVMYRTERHFLDLLFGLFLLCCIPASALFYINYHDCNSLGTFPKKPRTIIQTKSTTSSSSCSLHRKPTTPISSCKAKKQSSPSPRSSPYRPPCTSSYNVTAYEQCTVVALRRMLRERHSCTAGNKSVLIQRVVTIYANELNSMTVQQLRLLLKARGCIQQGRKSDLIQRLVEAGPIQK